MFNFSNAEGGNGFVSGSKSPEQLAEKLYRAYCMYIVINKLMKS